MSHNFDSSHWIAGSDSLISHIGPLKQMSFLIVKWADFKE